MPERDHPVSPTLRIKDLDKGNDTKEILARVAKDYLPLVYGCATALLGSSSPHLERVAVAVFETFRRRWRRLPKRTLIPSWLLFTTLFASNRERKTRPNTASIQYNSDTQLPQLLIEQWLRLPPRMMEAILLRNVLPSQPGPESLPSTPRVERRLDRKAASGRNRIQKKLRRKGCGNDQDVAALFAQIPVTPPEFLFNFFLEENAPPFEQDPHPRLTLVRAALWGWRWMRVKRWLKGFAVVCFTLLLLIGATGFTVAWMARTGRLTAWFIQNASQAMAKDHPEMLQPARPWPQLPEDAELVSKTAPEHAEGLYGLTNIWLAELRFTEAQWAGLQPNKVPPVPDLFRSDGKIILRNPNAQRSGLAGALGFDFNYTEAHLKFAGLDFPRVGARYRGNGTFVNSLFGPKQSFKVDLNRHIKGQKLAGIKTLNFLNLIADYSYLRDALGQQLFRDLGVPGPRTSYAYLTIQREKQPELQPLGLFLLVENIDSDFAEDRFGSKATPIFKPVTYDLFKDLGGRWEDYAAIYDLKTKATSEQQQRLIDFARLVTHADDPEFARRLPEFLDLEVFAAFVAGHVLLASYDGFLTNGQNYYMYLDPRTSRFGFISWDQDHGWGEFGYIGTADQREQASIWQPAVYQHHFLERVMKVEAFRSVYRQTLERALAEYFTEPRVFAQIDALAVRIGPAVSAESDFRKQRFELSVQSEWIPGPRLGAPEGPNAPVHQLKRFVTSRIQSVRDQLDGKSTGVRLGSNGF